MSSSSLVPRAVGPLVVGALIVAVVSACSPAPIPVSTSSRDPSSPSAPEGATPAVLASAPTTTSASTHAEHGGHDHGAHEHDATPVAEAEGHDAHVGGAPASDAGAKAAAYVCPMHPEVTSDKPGLCPKCNMKLVPKK